MKRSVTITGSPQETSILGDETVGLAHEQNIRVVSDITHPSATRRVITLRTSRRAMAAFTTDLKYDMRRRYDFTDA